MQRINIASPEFDFDATDPEGFRSGLFRLRSIVDTKRTGISVYDLPPGQSICPYHYEYAEEEWLLVLEGTPTLRHPGGTQVLDPMDLVFFPTGPEGAHGVRNGTDEPVRVLMFSNIAYPSASVYPDSDKIGIWTGDKEDDLLVHRESGVDYWSGETDSDDAGSVEEKRQQ
jgi:uncharacterized cupin superfamily protein